MPSLPFSRPLCEAWLAHNGPRLVRIAIPSYLRPAGCGASTVQRPHSAENRHFINLAPVRATPHAHRGMASGTRADAACAGHKTMRSGYLRSGQLRAVLPLVPQGGPDLAPHVSREGRKIGVAWEYGLRAWRLPPAGSAWQEVGGEERGPTLGPTAWRAGRSGHTCRAWPRPRGGARCRAAATCASRASGPPRSSHRLS